MAENVSPVPTVFRTLPTARRLVLLAYIPLCLLVIPLAILAVFVPPIAPFAIAFGLASLVGIVYAIGYAARTRVEFGDGKYRQVFALTEHAFTLDDVEKVVPVESLDYGLQSAPHLFVVGKTRRGLMQLNDQILERAQLEVLVNELAGRGVPIEHVRERLTVRQFARLYPGVLPWQLAHRGRFLALVTLVALVVLGIGAVWTVVNIVSTYAP